MGNEQIYAKQIIIANFKYILVLVALLCQFTKNIIVSSSWTSDFEFCEIRWFEFLNEKQKWDKRCGKDNIINMSACCLAKKEYLLYHFKQYSKVCLLEGKHFLMLYCQPNFTNLLFNVLYIVLLCRTSMKTTHVIGASC